MKTLTSSEFDAFCRRTSISIPKPEVGIGKDLTYGDGLLRTVVVQFIESDIPDYLLKILNTIFSLETTWLLIPRYTFRPDWNIPQTSDAIAALVFESGDVAVLSTLLLERLRHIKTVTDDLIVIAGSGHIIMKFDHHFLDEGLGLYLNDVDGSNQLLVALNTVGAELEVYYNNGV